MATIKIFQGNRTFQIFYFAHSSSRVGLQCLQSHDRAKFRWEMQQKRYIFYQQIHEGNLFFSIAFSPS